MSEDKQTPAVSSNIPDGGRPFSPGPSGLRKRASQRAFTFTEPATNTIRRRSSFFSDTISETHKTFLSSTDDLLLPRVKSVVSAGDGEDIGTTHWHSLPLGLALLPALAGVFFKDGSAVITDITLLALAAIFLNWALRLPWEWYRSAQATEVDEPEQPLSLQPIVEDDEYEGSELGQQSPVPGHADNQEPQAATQAADQLSARQELRVHEICALLACFIAPALGAWLLHAIRAQLSRPSEGLVSNYNLTIFLLVAELRPLSHLMKMIQRRTLFLQRRVSAAAALANTENDGHVITDLRDRLEELEAHIADRAAGESATSATTIDSPDALVAKVAAQTNADVRKSMQPELDALNRAMRRYEKRMTISAIQVEARLQDVETRLKDVVVLAAAAQRNAETPPQNFFMILVNWISAIIVIPIQMGVEVSRFPGRCAQLGLSWLQRVLRIQRSTRDQRNLRASNKQVPARPRPVLKKVKNLNQ